MKKLLPFLLFLTAFCVVSANAQDPMFQYNTFISENDIVNSDGERLKSVGEIVQQDRANVFKFGNPDSDPTEGVTNDFFDSKEHRAMIPGMVLNGPELGGKLKKAILRGDAFVTVSVYRTGSGRYYIGIEFNNA